MTSEFADLRAILEQYARGSDEIGFRRIAERVRAMQERLQAVLAETVSATDASGTVTATVTLGSQIKSVHISPLALRQMNTGALGRACLEAITTGRKAAADALSTRMEELSGPASPDDLNTVLRMLDQFR
ncbi:YbaB/EbfC family nucleoid-associated protein [Actinoallomurus purpureus]|uniref:YbaB/EbfC family nucleoid-associated protein n=1 Tax=Actinoallomurus purpureus TaxID=478114 RepID=UPI002092FCAF|nr:YbaB/EbfC family nucleoid-associated protein [Actinoallomurus purpureus]MCO6006943.1 YbaB/EbfC family nucleoid-associated protein [Actinoallomurus purpureus]